MSAASTVKIWREKAPIGGRLIVSVLATGPDGKGRESYAFAVGQNSVVTQSDVFDDDLPEDGEAAAPAPAAAPAGDAEADLFAAPASDDFAAEPAAPAAAEAPAQQQDNALDDFLF